MAKPDVKLPSIGIKGVVGRINHLNVKSDGP